MLGAAPAFAARPQRIVSVGGAVTETLFALGLGSRIAGADTTSTYPEAANALPRVGYTRQISAEGVLSMRPDLVLLTHNAGPQAAVAQLRASGVQVEQVANGHDAESVAAIVRRIGAVTQTPAPAEALADAIEDGFAALAAAIEGRPPARVLLLLSAGSGPLLAAGTGTAAASIVGLAGGEVAFPEMEGYRPVSPEAVLAADPDWVVVPAHVAQALGGPGAIAGLEAVRRCRAAREKRVAVADSLYLLGFGPRAPQAAADLAHLLHPSAAVPELGRTQVPSANLEVIGR